MATTDPTETPRKKKSKGASVIVWLFLIMMVVGLGGFGVTSFGGGVGSIGRVGDREIDVNDYARALRQDIDAFSAQVGTPIDMSQAQALGIDRQVRERLVTAAALDNEAQTIGLSVGDARVAAEIITMDSFQGLTGGFDRETYRDTLQRNNLTEARFETRIREDMARALLQGAVTGGFVAPAPMVDTLYAWAAEKRGFTMLRLSEADLAAPLPAPSDADLQAHYDANPGAFTAPEARRIAYAVLLPETLAPTMTVDETALQAMYDSRIAEFVQPERRLVERLVFADDAAAAAAKERIDAGTDFADLVAERGLTLVDVDLGEVSRDDLGAAAEPVFALTEPGVVGPLPSDLGPALYRMNGVLVAQEITFEDARADLTSEMGMDAARRAIADKIEQVDDLLAGGATLDDLVTEVGMTLGSIDMTPGNEEGIAAYETFRTAAAALTEGGFAEVITLLDGGLVAMRLDRVIPPTLRPFAEVTEAVRAGWQAETLAAALTARAEEWKALVAGGASPGSLGVADVTLSMPRGGFLEDTPPAVAEAVFAMAQGEARVIAAPGFVALVRLDSIQPPSDTDADAVAAKTGLAEQVAQGLAQDAFVLFTGALTAQAGIRMDEAAINAVHAQMQ